MALRLPPMQALRAFEAAARTQSLTKAAQVVESHARRDQPSDQVAGKATSACARRARGSRHPPDRRRRAVCAARAHRVRGIDDRRERADGACQSAPASRVASCRRSPRAGCCRASGAFVALHPDVDLDVRANMANIDFASTTPISRSATGTATGRDSGVELLFADRFFPVCSPRLANGRLPEQPADLARYPLLRAEDEFWKPWFEAAGVDWPEPTRGPIFNDSSYLMQAAAEGQGIALARSCLLGNDVRNGVLVRLFDIEVPAPRRHYLVYPPRTANSPEARALSPVAARRDRIRPQRDSGRAASAAAPRGRAQVMRAASRSAQYRALPGVRGNGITSRTLASPVT